MFQTAEFGIYDIVYSYAKIYPNMTKLITYNQPSKVRAKGWEPINQKPSNNRRQVGTDPMYVIESLRRTKTRLSDIVTSNQFDLFCTFTFKDDRENIDHSKRKMVTWLKNQNKRVGKFEYLIVPEFHKDGKAIHFHALFKGYKGKLVDIHFINCFPLPAC